MVFQRGKDAWIDSYLDEVRSSLKGVRFVELSDYVDPRKAVEFCEKNGAVLASAQECAFFSIVNDLKDHKLRMYTSTFSFGFKEGGDSVVAYAEVPHKDWLYLIGKMPGLLSREDPVVSSAIARAVDEGRVVSAKMVGEVSVLVFQMMIDLLILIRTFIIARFSSVLPIHGDC